MAKYNWYILWIIIIAACGFWLLLKPTPPVQLSWETASEVGTAGFNVYRATAVTDPFVKVNPTLIPALGDEVTGANYSFTDDAVTPGKTYLYRIEEVEWNGTVNMYPESVTVRAGLPRLWVKLEGGILLILAFVLFLRNGKYKRGNISPGDVGNGAEN